MCAGPKVDTKLYRETLFARLTLPKLPDPAQTRLGDRPLTSLRAAQSAGYWIWTRPSQRILRFFFWRQRNVKIKSGVYDCVVIGGGLFAPRRSR